MFSSLYYPLVSYVSIDDPKEYLVYGYVGLRIPPTTISLVIGARDFLSSGGLRVILMWYGLLF